MNLSKLLWIIAGLLVVALVAVSGYLFLGREEIDPSITQVPSEVGENKFEGQVVKNDITKPSEVSLDLISPNGGESFDISKSITIRYKLSDSFKKQLSPLDKVELYLVDSKNVLIGYIGEVDKTAGEFNWNTQKLFRNGGLDFSVKQTPAGQYRILIVVRKEHEANDMAAKDTGISTIDGFIYSNGKIIQPGANEVWREQPITSDISTSVFTLVNDVKTVVDWQKEWEKHIPAIRSKINAYLSRSNPNGDDKITKEEFLDITKDGIPEFHISYVTGRYEAKEIFYFTGSSYKQVMFEKEGIVSPLDAGSEFGRAAGRNIATFLSNGDVCRVRYEEQSGGREAQLTWNKARQLFIEAGVNQECKQIAFEVYKSFIFSDQQLINGKMNITVYVQDQSKLNQTCGATKPLIVEVPKTTAVADASLRYLFISGLAKYGVYEQDSVTIENGIAKVYIYEKTLSLASCEHEHLFSVLEKTLTQYSTIKKVELYRASDRSKIEF